MNSRTVLVNPFSFVPPQAPTRHLPRLTSTRWVTQQDGRAAWTMTNPGLRRRHRRVAALAYAPLHPRVLVSQILLPTVLVCAIGAIAGIGLASLFPSPHVPAWLIIGFILAMAIAVAMLSLVTRWRQGAEQSPHVVQVNGHHAQALIDIEAEIEAYNATCHIADAKLSAPELLWTAAHDARVAVAIARTLAVLPPEEDVRVLHQLRTLARDDCDPGNVTTLQSMVRTPESSRNRT